MTTETEVINEEVTNIVNEEAPEPPAETKIEAKSEEPIKNDIKTEEEPEFKNKTDRMKNKKVNCKDCGANLTLKTLRYSHKCSKTEDKEVKPKPKNKPKPKAVAISTIPQTNQVVTHEEPVYLKQVKQNIKPIEQPVIKSPQEIIQDNFKLIQQGYMNKRREKANALTQSMFQGGLRSKRR